MRRVRNLLRLSTAIAAPIAVGCRGGLSDTRGNQPSSAGGASSGDAAGSAGAVNGVPSSPTEADCSMQFGERRLWRLTPAQYDATIHDLLGVDGTWGRGFPADAVVQGFYDGAATLTVTPLLADKLRDAAEDIAQKVALSRLAPCASAATDAACTQQVVTQLGARAFRRPLDDAAVQRYVALAKTAGSFEAGARLVVTAMLQSPHFLYRFELGAPDAAGRYALDDYEIASELSYLLWQSTPDDALLQAADSGSLHTTDQIRAQVDRMLRSERSKPMARAFVLQWLGLSALATVPKDPGRFPDLTPELRAELGGEIERFVDHVMFDLDGSPSALLTAPTTYLDAALASFYGVSLERPDTQGIAAMSLSTQSRRGILTLGGTMLVHARSNDSSPIQRGKLVRERLLCQPLPPPPPGIAIQPPALDPTKTTRERYAAHSQQHPCVDCHHLMDPIGLAFEHFDGIGRYRSDDNGHPIDTGAQIVDSPSTDGSFPGSEELIDGLAASADVRGCYAREWLRFAYGMEDDAQAGCIAKRVQEDYSGSDGSLGALIAILTEGEQLRFRRGSGATGAVTAVTADAGSKPRTDAATTAVPDAGGPIQPVADAVTAGLTLSRVVDNDWGAGYCYTYEIKNQTGAPIAWSVPLDVDGTLNQHWQSEISASAGRVVFTGASYNATLEPGATTQFGFCAMR
jgi:Protein of unknown function (DUF1592)/Protein of unknown function (DUF1588)/Protein of unknown function (DUF1595)/Protein of unknown function (DUF1587)/Cellulose binding domain